MSFTWVLLLGAASLPQKLGGDKTQSLEINSELQLKIAVSGGIWWTSKVQKLMQRLFISISNPPSVTYYILF